jgi:hypothetical protein
MVWVVESYSIVARTVYSPVVNNNYAPVPNKSYQTVLISHAAQNPRPPYSRSTRRRRMFGLFRKASKARKAETSSEVRLAIAPEARATALGEDGIVLLHTGTGKLFTSNAVGARIWRGIAEKASLRSIAAAISSELGVSQQQVEQDATQFIAALQLRGLVYDVR